MFLRLLLCVGTVSCATFGLAADTSPVVIPGWGQVVDPDGDCAVKEESGKLIVFVPGSLNDLNALNGNLKAPRVVQEVEGDFLAEVKVTGKFEPGKKSTGRGAPFNGAGLIVWGDERNYIRLERNKYWTGSNSERPICYPPLFEVFKDGANQRTNPTPTMWANFFQGDSTSFRLERKGDKVTASYSHDGNQWTMVKEVTVDLPGKVLVGVAAINSSDAPFVPEFSGFKVKTPGAQNVTAPVPVREEPRSRRILPSLRRVRSR